MDSRSHSLRAAAEPPPVLHARKVAVVFFATLLACHNPVGVREFQELIEAEQKWAMHDIDHYTFEMRTQCFCGREVTEWAVVEVRNGEVISARSLSGATLSGLSLTSRKSVEELFDLAHNYRPDWLAKVDFEFEPVLGYPVMLNYISKPNIADAGNTYEARNLRAITP